MSKLVCSAWDVLHWIESVAPILVLPGVVDYMEQVSTGCVCCGTWLAYDGILAASKVVPLQHTLSPCGVRLVCQSSSLA